MPYVTLLEATQIVHRETGVDITVTQLIRAGAVQNLPLCVLLNVKCYSPTHRIRREQNAEELNPDYWHDCPIDSINHADVVYEYGLFLLPMRHVFDYQTNEIVKIQSVTSMDGQDIYYPSIGVSRDQIQITLHHLTAFMERIKAAKTDAATPAPVTVNGKKWTDEKLTELKKFRNAHTMSETAFKFGISEQRIRQLLPRENPKATPFAGLIYHTR